MLKIVGYGSGIIKNSSAGVLFKTLLEFVAISKAMKHFLTILTTSVRTVWFLMVKIGGVKKQAVVVRHSHVCLVTKRSTFPALS